jgi:hypothetical protein
MHKLIVTIPRMLNRTWIRWFPSSDLGMQSWKLQLPDSRSWSFANGVPKPELGNQRKIR